MVTRMNIAKNGCLFRCYLEGQVNGTWQKITPVWEKGTRLEAYKWLQRALHVVLWYGPLPHEWR